MLRPILLLAAAALSAGTLAADAHRMTWDDLLARPRPRTDATMAYGADPYQRVDVRVPKGRGPFPGVLMVHGGCWRTGIADRTLMDWAAA